MVAIVVPEKPQLEKWAKDNNIEFSSYDELCKNEKVAAFLLNDIKTNGKAGGLFGFEIPTKIHISAELFSADNDLLTPTFKLKRNEAKNYFLKQIKEMYDGAKL